MSDEQTGPAPDTSATPENKPERKKPGRKPRAESATVPAPPPGMRSVYVTAHLPSRPESAAEDTEPYWIGCLPGGPTDRYSFGGHSFPIQTKPVIEDGKQIGPLQFTRRVGGIVYLAPEQVPDILQDVKRFVVRRESKNPRTGRVLNTEDFAEDRLLRAPPPGSRTVDTNTPRMVNRYKRIRRDYPVAHHLYLIPWAERGMFVGYDEAFIVRPRTIAVELELDVPAWVDDEINQHFVAEQLAKARGAAPGTPDPTRLDPGFGPTMDQAKAFLAARGK